MIFDRFFKQFSGILEHRPHAVNFVIYLGLDMCDTIVSTVAVLSLNVCRYKVWE